MKRSISSFLTAIDLLGYYPQLCINRGYVYNTSLGGFISIFVWIGIFYALIAYTIDVLFIRQPSVVNYSVLRSDVPVFNYTANDQFEFMLVFFDDDYNIVNPDRNLIDMQFLNIHKFFNQTSNRGSEIKYEIDDKYQFGNCSVEIKKKMFESFNEYLKNVPDQVLCPQYDVNQKRKIGGSLLYQSNEYETKIIIGPKCANSSYCTNEEINNYINYTSTVATNILFATNYFIPNPKQINPKTNVFKHSLAELKNTANKFTVKFAEVYMETESNLFPLIGFNDKATFFTVDDIYIFSRSHGKNIDTIKTEFSILITDFVNRYERNYPKIDSIITRFFSFYLYLLYVGNILRRCLHTFNLERYLINSTLINESNIKIKIDKGGDNTQQSNSKFCSEKPNNLDLSINDMNSMNSFENINSDGNNLRVNLVLDRTNNLENDISSINPNKSIQQKTISCSVDTSSDCMVVFQDDSKINKIKKLCVKINDLKVKVGLKQRYSCSSLPENFKSNVQYLYQVLDTRNMIKLYLQFEKLKQIVFNPKQKLIFELFSVDISFLNSKLYNKNIEDMNEEELKLIIEYLENINNDADEISKNLIKLLPIDFKKIIFDNPI